MTKTFCDHCGKEIERETRCVFQIADAFYHGTRVAILNEVETCSAKCAKAAAAKWIDEHFKP